MNFRPMQERQLHVNSIDYNAETDQILLSVLTYNEICVQQHGTTIEEAAGSEVGSRGAPQPPASENKSSVASSESTLSGKRFPAR